MRSRATPTQAGVLQFINHIYILYVATFAAAAAGCCAGLLILRHIDDPDTRRGLYGFFLASAGWAATQVGFLVAPTSALKIGSYTLGLVFGFATVGGWLYFCSAYTGRTYHRNPTYRRVAVVVFAVVVGVKITNPFHHGYFTTTHVSAPFPHLSVQTGALHWTAMGLAYALTFVGFFMLFELFVAVDFDTRPLLALIGTTTIPVFLDVFGYATPLLVDMTYEPLGVAVFAVGVAVLYGEQFEAIRLAGERETPIVALDGNGRIRDANRAAQELFPPLTAARGELLEAVLPDVTARLDDETPIVELQREGTTRYFRITETPLTVAKGGTGRTVVFSDVTERERYRNELERQNERLETFAGMVSHDLRNPLNVAQGRLELARERVDDEEGDLAKVSQALERMEALIGEILSLARNGNPVEQWDSIRLAAVVEDCWGMVETSGAELVVEGDVVFEGDTERVKRLFENLLRNAVDHAGEDVTVTVGALEDGFYLADDGSGIPEAERRDVFEAGYTTRESGTGFGLAIVSEIVEAHDWAIAVTESAAGGARFEITGVETSPGA